MKNKLNNKGMVISGVLYSILILFVALVFGVLALLSSSNYTFAKVKTDVLKELNGSSSDFCYEFDYSTGTILNYYGEINGCGNKVVIPETIDGVPVQTISSGAFYNKGIERVDLSNAIMLKTIEGGTTSSEGAFANNKIKYLTFGDNSFLEEIGAYAFYNNQISGELVLSGITTLRKISQDAFAKNKLSSVDFSGLKILEVIDDMAFYGNSLNGILSFDDTTKLERIGIGAFAGNNISDVETTGLSKLELIDNYAFHGNVLETFDFTKLLELKEIGRSAFSYNQLQVADFSNTKLETIKYRAFEKNALKTVRFPQTIISVGDHAFYDNVIEGHLDLSMVQTNLGGNYIFDKNKISSFTFGGTYINVGMLARNNLTSITSDNFLKTTISVGAGGFFNNTNLTTVDLSFVTQELTIGQGAFARGNISNLSFPHTKKPLTINTSAFARNNLSGVIDLSYSDYLYVGVYAFRDNNLTGVTLPDDPKQLSLLQGCFTGNQFVGDNAFILDSTGKKLMSYAGEGGDVTIPEGIESLEGSSLSHAGITSIHFPSTLKTIGIAALSNNPIEGKLDFSTAPHLQTISANALSVYVTPDVQEDKKTVEKCILYNSTDSSDHSKYLGDLSCKQVDKYAFNYAQYTNAGNDTITSIDFTGLTELTLIDGNAFYLLFANEELIGTNTLTSLNKIGNNAFRENRALKRGIDFSGSPGLKTMGSYTFQGVRGYTGIVDLSNTQLTNVPDNFLSTPDSYLSSIEEVRLPDSLIQISQRAFYRGGVKKITFPTSLSSIGTKAFQNSDFGDGFELNSNIKSIGSNAFQSSNITGELVIPSKVTTLADSSFYGNKISGTLKIPASVKTIGGHAFGNNKIQTIDLSESTMTLIENLAFNSNSSLKNIIWNDKIKSIGRYAFSNGTYTTLTIPANVEEIGTNAFVNSSTLKTVVIEGDDTHPVDRFNNRWNDIGFNSAPKPEFGYNSYTVETDKVNLYDSTVNVRRLYFDTEGYYRLETWGAQGGSYSATYRGGYGGYAAGTIYVPAGTYIYLFVGTQPKGYTSVADRYEHDNPGGFNGGGSSLTGVSGNCDLCTTYALGGGGATDFRIAQDMHSRIVVAGGGSGSSNKTIGYAAGGLTSSGYDSTVVATQTKAGQQGSFGYGGNSPGQAYQFVFAPGGGGGWYGGGSSKTVKNTKANSGDDKYMRLTGGGSSYVYSEESAKDYPTDGVIPSSSYYATNVVIYGGNEIDTNGDPLGNIGDGHARVTYLGTTLVVPTTPDDIIEP